MTHGSCLFGDCMYNLDILVVVIPVLVFLVCWGDENCLKYSAYGFLNYDTVNGLLRVLFRLLCLPLLAALINPSLFFPAIPNCFALPHKRPLFSVTHAGMSSINPFHNKRMYSPTYVTLRVYCFLSTFKLLTQLRRPVTLYI